MALLMQNSVEPLVWKDRKQLTKLRDSLSSCDEREAVID
jgi:hypothetical protein